MLLHYALTHHTWLILLVASVVGAASPRGPADDRYRAGHSSPSRHARRYVDTFRGGAIIDVPREDEEEEEEEEGGGRDGGGNGAPAILAVAATWNVPRIMPNPGADLRDVNNRHEMAQWVGVTGGRCDGSEAGALLQAGTSVAVRSITPPFPYPLSSLCSFFFLFFAAPSAFPARRRRRRRRRRRLRIVIGGFP